MTDPATITWAELQELFDQDFIGEGDGDHKPLKEQHDLFD